MSLAEDLVLVDYLTAQLGGDREELFANLRNVDEGRRPDGQSTFYGEFEQRESRLSVPLELLREFDINLLNDEAVLASQRVDFRLKYFQYLATLYVELFLFHMTEDPAGFLLGLEEHRRQHFPHLSSVTVADLRKCALWMATGAGKTLMLHLNLLQFRRYRPFEPDNTLVIAPTPMLAEQHLAELRRSGFHAMAATDQAAAMADVQVIEVTKLYLEGDGWAPSGGVSLPTSYFEGRNLLFVDEGHKGSRTRTEEATERAWRDIREDLAEAGGMTFEYSATFAQVTEGAPELLNEYAKVIGFEYSYRRFHADGYGKDFAVANLRKESDAFGEVVLMAGLLTLYEASRYFESQADSLVDYQVEAPLMVFVGAQVTAGTEVLQIVRFLDKVLREPAWAEEQVSRLLTGASGLTGVDGRDAFIEAFPYLKSLGEAARLFVSDIYRRLFGGTAHLTLQRLTRQDGEIGMRAATAGLDAYCGVVNVGDAKAFLRKVEAETELEVGPDDHFSASLFDSIDDPASPLAFLVGSKKFIEGWNSWRVLVMGLLSVGMNAGAQVLQLFGRGVRLRGRELSLRRSSASTEEIPAFLRLLETLSIFGIKANYLQTFLSTMQREGLQPARIMRLPLAVGPHIVESGLMTLRTDDNFSFASEVVEFDGVHTEVQLDLLPVLTIGGAESVGAGRSDQPYVALPDAALWRREALYQHALEHKRRRGWHNLFVTRESIDDLLTHARVRLPAELAAPTSPESAEHLHRASARVVERGLDAFFYRRQRASESDRLRRVTLTSEDPNIPRMREQPDVPSYTLRVPDAVVDEVKGLLDNRVEVLTESLEQPLPRLHLDFHLYNPLLLKGEVAVTPAGLEPSERVFAMDLRAFWTGAVDDSAWSGWQVFLLRNLPKRGVGFFATAGFYPDFQLWLKSEGGQSLAFVDPKGLTHWQEEKVALLEDIRELSFGAPVLAYIVTPTPLRYIQVPGIQASEREAYLAGRGVLRQEGDYISRILGEMQRAVV